MAHTNVKLEINPEIIEKLSLGGGKLWIAAHEDDSKNRVDVEAIADAALLDIVTGFFVAGYQLLKKRLRNLGKTKDDVAAEKEASQINRTCGALEQMLLEYIRAAQEGEIDAEALDELIGTLKEMQGYYEARKLSLPGESTLVAIGDSVAVFTANLLGSEAARKAEASATNLFSRISAHLLQQKAWAEEKGLGSR